MKVEEEAMHLGADGTFLDEDGRTSKLVPVLVKLLQGLSSNPITNSVSFVRRELEVYLIVVLLAWPQR